MTDQTDPGDRDRRARLRLAARGEVSCSAVWRLDIHAGSGTVLTAHGTCAKPLTVVVDNRSRLAVHVQGSCGETIDSLIHGFRRSLMRCGLPRTVETDNAASGKRSPRLSTPK